MYLFSASELLTGMEVPSPVGIAVLVLPRVFNDVSLHIRQTSNICVVNITFSSLIFESNVFGSNLYPMIMEFSSFRIATVTAIQSDKIS